MKRADQRAWYKGPLFMYKDKAKRFTVNVALSSWPIRGLPEADAVIQTLKRSQGQSILDFGAGSWLRYVQQVRALFPARQVFAVEYADAFHDDALIQREALENDVTIWSPNDFIRQTRRRFDLILLINVLNVVPEEAHRRAILRCLASRLNPSGWLLLYQRIWVRTENPAGAIEYGDGWLVPQKNYNAFTYRARTGNRWFSEAASRVSLRPLDPPVKISSANTLLRLWEKPF